MAVMMVMASGLLAQVDEDEFREWLVDGYGSYLLFVLAILLLVALVLRGTRSKY